MNKYTFLKKVWFLDLNINVTKKSASIFFLFLLKTYQVSIEIARSEHFSLVNGQAIVHTLISLRGPISDTIFRFTEAQDVTNREDVSQATVYELNTPRIHRTMFSHEWTFPVPERHDILLFTRWFFRNWHGVAIARAGGLHAIFSFFVYNSRASCTVLHPMK